ncbi:sugar ABC transporter substrate-binding protein [Rahnella sp. SAP-1]|uniref:Sugar ABC transporter substrate-binding protein n=1 Tax=Rouxiella aceris TaxID=2703884 RepID=A0A848MH86_9GAMM|nr:substrate-binding domain-containing protein [Rouxiella aceris]NMP26523.1 sugar ABC transporter substrate-binding protein [Rouxiella aceris]
MKKSYALFACLLASLSLMPLAKAAPETPQFRCKPGETYYMNVMVTGVEYWFPVYEMFKQAAHQLGCKTVYGGTPAYDVNQQLTSFEQMLAQKPAGIFLHPMNPDPFIEPINRAAEMGIPVVTFAADSPNSKRVAYITSDNFREGKAAADEMGKAIAGKGEYAVLENPGQDNHDRRVSAFINEMKTAFPQTQLVARAATNQDPSKAYNAVLSILQAHPNLAVLFMPEASSAIGAAQAVAENGGKVKVMTVDVNAKVLDMIKSGEVYAAIDPNQGVQGYMGFMTLFLAAHPELIDPMNDAKRSGSNPFAFPLLDNGYAVVTKDNADDFRWDSYLKRRGSKGINE